MFSNFKLGFLIFLRSCDVDVRRVSVKPSRGPLTTASVSGGITFRLSQPCKLAIRAAFDPSTKSAVSPDKTAFTVSWKSFTSLTSLMVRTRRYMIFKAFSWSNSPSAFVNCTSSIRGFIKFIWTNSLSTRPSTYMIKAFMGTW